MEHELLSPISDIVFKMLFGNEQNTDILSAFLKAVLLLPDEEFSEVLILNPFLGKLRLLFVLIFIGLLGAQKRSRLGNFGVCRPDSSK